MRILELCTSDGLGGLELYVAKCVRWLLRLGHEVVPVTNASTMLSNRLADEGVGAHHLSRRSKRFPLLAAFRLARAIDREQIDIVHLHWGHDLLLAVLAKQFAKRPVRLVYTRQMALTRSKRDFYHRFLYRNIDCFLTITRQLQQQAFAYLPMSSDKIQLLYYGVPEAKLPDCERRRALRAEYGVDNDSVLLVGAVGRIEEAKGQHLIVEAVAQLHAEGVPVKALFVGPAMDEAYLGNLKLTVSARGLEELVGFAGSHPNPQTLMPAFDVLVLSTRMETFGLVLIEAMRAGTAVVGTAAGGVPEIIDDGDTGMLFPPDDATALADCLRRLYKDPALRQRMAMAGKRSADERFTEERHFAKLEEIFGQLSSH